jgi:hypothetical protein
LFKELGAHHARFTGLAEEHIDLNKKVMIRGSGNHLEFEATRGRFFETMNDLYLV